MHARTAGGDASQRAALVSTGAELPTAVSSSHFAHTLRAERSRARHFLPLAGGILPGPKHELPPVEIGANVRASCFITHTALCPLKSTELPASASTQVRSPVPLSLSPSARAAASARPSRTADTCLTDPTDCPRTPTTMSRTTSRRRVRRGGTAARTQARGVHHG